MSAEDIITAYDVAVPEAQQQNLPGLDKKMEPHLEYSKQEYWDDNGKPYLKEYAGSEKLKGKTAIVTGGDSGIGRSAAICFAREGATGITLSYLPEEEPDAQDAKKMIEAGTNTKVNLFPGDLMDHSVSEKLVESHIKAFGKLDILVNNASKQIINKDFQTIELEQIESTFKSNIIQMMAVTKFALPHLKRGSSIINTSSVTSYRGSKQLVDYASTKGAITAFTRSLAQQLAPKGIRVNGVAPGPIITALQAASRPPDDMEGLGVGLPLHGRAGQPAEAGPTYVFLAAPDTNIMTGQFIHINSGQHIGGS